MMFATPEELAAHLAQTIDDEGFIAKAVRIKFPDWNCGEARSDFRPQEDRPRPERRPYSLAKNHRYALRNNKKPDDDGWLAAEYSSKVFNAMIESGTTSLLRALHDSHPQILSTLKANGREVVQP